MSENMYLKSKEESLEKNQIQLTVVLFPILFCHLTDTCHLSLTLRLVLGLKTDFLSEYTISKELKYYIFPVLESCDIRTWQYFGASHQHSRSTAHWNTG